MPEEQITCPVCGQNNWGLSKSETSLYIKCKNGCKEAYLNWPVLVANIPQLLEGENKK